MERVLAPASEAEVVFLGGVYRPIRENNAWAQVEFVWCSETEDPAIGRFFACVRDGDPIATLAKM